MHKNLRLGVSIANPCKSILSILSVKLLNDAVAFRHQPHLASGSRVTHLHGISKLTGAGAMLGLLSLCVALGESKAPLGGRFGSIGAGVVPESTL